MGVGQGLALSTVVVVCVTESGVEPPPTAARRTPHDGTRADRVTIARREGRYAGALAHSDRCEAPSTRRAGAEFFQQLDQRIVWCLSLAPRSLWLAISSRSSSMSQSTTACSLPRCSFGSR